jgi:catechol 2,3-dioxygenase
MSVPSRSDGGHLPPETRVGRVALRVADVDAVADFYREVVGLVDLLDQGGDGAVVLGVGDTPLLVLQPGATRSRPASAAGLYHTAFRVPSRAALGDTLARIRDDWQLEGASDHRVSEALYLSDPEGNGVEIYRDRPREEWPTDRDGSVRMGTDRLDLGALAAAAHDAEDPTDASRAPDGTDVGHVHLEVSSLERFVDWAVDAVGLTVRQRVPRAVFVAAGGYHHHVGANTWGGRSGPAPDDGRGLAWFELVVPTAVALEAVRARLAEAEASVVTASDEGVVVDGPDGLTVRFRPES